MNKEQETKLIEMTVQGASERIIAGELGVNQSTVNRAKHQPTIRQQIKSLQERVITELSETAFENVKHAISYYKNPIQLIRYTDTKGKQHLLKVSDDQLREHGAKFSLEVMRAAGALPSHSTSIVIQQIFNNPAPEVPQVIKDILDTVTHRDLAGKNYLDGFETEAPGRTEPVNSSTGRTTEKETETPGRETPGPGQTIS